MALQSINPATGEVIEEYDELNEREIDSRLSSAMEAFHQWRKSSFDHRSEKFRNIASLLRSQRDRWAEIMVREMGKPITEARSEVEKCAWVCDHYATHAASFLETELMETDASNSYVRYDPLGPVLAVMPWNFPYWQVFRFAAPAVMAGNVGLLKHASNVSGCALAIAEMFREAGFPEGVFQTLLLSSSRTEPLIRDNRVRAVTLTGSAIAGKQVAAAAGNEIKKSVMELGGSDPFIVLSDADVGDAVEVGSAARCINSGQSCIAAKRFIVVEKHLDEFREKFVDQMKSKVVGDPMEEATQVGPLAREDLREDLDDQVQESVMDGAEILLGGTQIVGPGFYYEPTVLGGVRHGMVAAEEETFGPVAAIMSARDDEDALRIANDSKYGLGASLWTRDIEKGERFAGEIEAGCVFINGLVKSDPRLPFGGVKASGYGRELGAHGIREFMNVKSVWISE